jgi:hypothetical protein
MRAWLTLRLPSTWYFFHSSRPHLALWLYVDHQSFRTHREPTCTSSNHVLLVGGKLFMYLSSPFRRFLESPSTTLLAIPFFKLRLDHVANYSLLACRHSCRALWYLSLSRPLSWPSLTFFVWQSSFSCFVVSTRAIGKFFSRFSRFLSGSAYESLRHVPNAWLRL